MYSKVMRTIDAMHNCRSYEQLDKIVSLNVEKWITMKTMKEFGLYFKTQWINSKFNKWQLLQRDLGLAITNSPLESYNGRIKNDFTDRTYFNLVPAFKKLERLIEFDSLEESIFITKTSVSASDELSLQGIYND